MSKKSRISDVFQLYQELCSVAVPDIRYLIIKDGQRIGGAPVFGFNGFYCLENSADMWLVYYEDQSGQKKMHLKCAKESQACVFFYTILADKKTPYRSPYPDDYFLDR